MSLVKALAVLQRLICRCGGCSAPDRAIWKAEQEGWLISLMRLSGL